MIHKIKNKEKVTLFFILILLQLFGTILIPNRTYILLACELLLFYYLIIDLKNKKNTIEVIILAITVFVIISCIVSFSIHKQDFFRVLGYAYPFLGIQSYFILKHYKISEEGTLNLLKILMALMVLGYIIQWLVYPTVIFKSALATSVNEKEGVFRMRFVGSLCTYLLFFYGLNQFFNKNKSKYLLYTFLGAIPIIIMGFRSLIFTTIVAAIIMAIQIVPKVKYLFTYSILIVFFTYGALRIPLVQNKILEMQTRTESGENFTNTDYVRVVGLKFYENYFSKNTIVRTFGGGRPLISRFEGPSDRTNNYQKSMFRGASSGLLWNDLGIIGLSYIIGSPAVFLILLLLYKSVRQCKSKELQFVRYTLLATVAGSIITSMEIYRDGNFILIGILIYYISCYNKNSYVNQKCN